MNRIIGWVVNEGLYRPRWLQKLFAFIAGYFWLPCPLCGAEFGGHEWRRWDYGSIPTGRLGESQAICPRSKHHWSRWVPRKDIQRAIIHRNS